MLSAGGKPILRHVVEALAQCNIRDIIIVVGYHREQIFDVVGDGADMGVTIRYAIQECQAGTAHALGQTAALAADEFLLLPGDHLIKPDTIRDFVAVQPWALLTARVPENQTVRYGVVKIDSGMVQSVIEKPKDPCCAPVSTGIFALKQEIFDFIGDDGDMPAVINRMIGAGISFRAVETAGPWLDIVYPWDILSLNDYILGSLKPALGGIVEKGTVIKGIVAIGDGGLIRSGCYINGPALVGQGCTLGPSVVIGADVSLGDNVSIGSFSVIENCVIGNDVSIGPGAVIQDSVIDSGCRIGANFNAGSGLAEIRIAGEFHWLDTGTMIGCNCEIASGVVAMPGSILGNGSRVQALKVITGNIADGSQVV